MNTMKNVLCTLRDLTISASFWKMAFVAFLLRLFVAQPFGALLALIMGTVWCIGNWGGIQNFARSVHKRLFA
jgi:hypothetical protein